MKQQIETRIIQENPRFVSLEDDCLNDGANVAQMVLDRMHDEAQSDGIPVEHRQKLIAALLGYERLGFKSYPGRSAPVMT